MDDTRLVSIISFIIIIFWTVCSVSPAAYCFEVNGGRGNQHIETSFGLEVFLVSDDADDISIGEIDPLKYWPSLDGNRTLDIFFNISSPVLTMVNVTFKYHFDYSYGERAASFYPETFAFSLIEDGILKPWKGAVVDMNEHSVTHEMNNLDVRSPRSITITGESDLEPPDAVSIESIVVEEEGEASIEFLQVEDAVGYYLYLTDQKCVNIEGIDPYNSEPFVLSPIIVDHLEEGEEIYISISAVDFAGNINPQVDCNRFKMGMPNRAPTAKIDPMEDTYYTGELVYFTCRETFDPDPHDELTYEWDLDGDGRKDSSLETPTFTYTGANTYAVKLTVTDRDGLKDSYNINIEILDREGGNDEGSPERGNFEGIYKYKWLIVVIVIISTLLIAIIALVLLNRKRTALPPYAGEENEEGKVRFQKKGDGRGKPLSDEREEVRTGETVFPSRTGDRRSLNEDRHIYGEPRPYQAAYNEWADRGMDIMDELGGRTNVIPEEELIRFLPQRGTLRPRKKKRRARRGNRRKKRSRGEKAPVVAAVVFPEEEGGEKKIRYYSCPGCEEVLEIAVRRKGEVIQRKYSIPCPICGLKGELLID